MSGLTNSTTGLSYGVGLIYPIVPENLPSTETFSGTGNLSASAIVARRSAAAFGGAGSLSVNGTVSP